MRPIWQTGKHSLLSALRVMGRMGYQEILRLLILLVLSALYIEKSLVDYKKGVRHDRRMSLIAQGLKKSQIKDLAAWYSAFEVTAKVPEI